MDNVAERATDPEAVVTALLLTDADPDRVTTETVSAWTEDQRSEAYEWATREHLGASDNDDVRRLRKPAHVEALGVVVL